MTTRKTFDIGLLQVAQATQPDTNRETPQVAVFMAGLPAVIITTEDGIRKLRQACDFALGEQ